MHTLKIAALCVLAICAANLSAVSPASPPAAVVICGDGYESGHRFAPGDSVANRSGSVELFILRADYRVITIPPGNKLRLGYAQPRTSRMFEESVHALENFERRWESLHTWLLKQFPDSLPADTVEGFLVYPLNARLLDHPEAFKWQGDSLSSRFALYPAGDKIPVFETVTNMGRVKREQVDSLTIPGSRYRWEARTGARQDSAWFQVLTDSQTLDLGRVLETMDDLERQDNEGKHGPRAWTWLKTAFLADRELYYEARELIRTDWNRDPSHASFYSQLLQRVRYMQLFGGAFRPGP